MALFIYLIIIYFFNLTYCNTELVKNLSTFILE